MRMLKIALTVVVMLCIIAPLYSQTADTSSSDTAALEQVERDNQAKALYQQGEASYKAGNLEAAIMLWMQTMELKPDSAYTSKRLAQAREEFYKKLIAEVDKELSGKDNLTAHVKLNAASALLPGKNDLPEKAEKFKDKLNEGEKKALAAFEEALGYLNKQDFANAKQSISLAAVYAKDSKCIKEVSSFIMSIEGDGPGHVVAKTEQNSLGMPRLYKFGAEWCGPCKKMKPIIAALEEKYAGRVEIVSIDVDANKAMARDYGVGPIPHMMIFDAHGNKVYEHVGGVPQQMLEAELDRVLAE